MDLKMKTKLIEKISSIYTQIVASEKELNSTLPGSDNVDRANKINLGLKVIKLQELNISLFNTIDIFLEVASGSLDELPSEINTYYSLVKEVQKPSSVTDSDEIKKIKEFINNYKKDAIQS